MPDGLTTNALPFGLPPEHVAHYERRRTYTTWDRPPVVRPENVMVGRAGVVLGAGGVIPESIQRDRIRLGYQLALRSLLRPPMLVRRSEPALVIHNLWSVGGYYHWIADSLPRLLAVEDELPNLTLLLPARARKVRFVLESLSIFSFRDIRYLPDNRSFFVRRLVLPSVPATGLNISPPMIRRARDLFWKACDDAGLERVTGPKLYVSRSRSRSRSLVNEEEVSRLLRRYGYETVYFEELSFLEQVNAMRHCVSMIGPHGAGLANVVFMPPRSTMLEITRYPGTKVDYVSPVFWNLANAADVTYGVCMSPMEQDERVPFDKCRFVVDLGALERRLEEAETRLRETAPSGSRPGA